MPYSAGLGVDRLAIWEINSVSVFILRDKVFAFQIGSVTPLSPCLLQSLLAERYLWEIDRAGPPDRLLQLRQQVSS
jgi:hypothetical protein